MVRVAATPLRALTADASCIERLFAIWILVIMPYKKTVLTMTFDWKSLGTSCFHRTHTATTATARQIQCHTAKGPGGA